MVHHTPDIMQLNICIYSQPKSPTSHISVQKGAPVLLVLRRISTSPSNRRRICPPLLVSSILLYFPCNRSFEMHTRFVVLVLDLVRIEMKPCIAPRPGVETPMPFLIPNLAHVQYEECEVEDAVRGLHVRNWSRQDHTLHKESLK